MIPYASYSYLGLKLHSGLYELARDERVLHNWPELSRTLEHLGDAINTIAHDIERDVLREGADTTTDVEDNGLSLLRSCLKGQGE